MTTIQTTPDVGATVANPISSALLVVAAAIMAVGLQLLAPTQDAARDGAGHDGVVTALITLAASL